MGHLKCPCMYVKVCIGAFAAFGSAQSVALCQAMGSMCPRNLLEQVRPVLHCLISPPLQLFCQWGRLLWWVARLSTHKVPLSGGGWLTFQNCAMLSMPYRVSSGGRRGADEKKTSSGADKKEGTMVLTSCTDMVILWPPQMGVI